LFYFVQYGPSADTTEKRPPETERCSGARTLQRTRTPAATGHGHRRIPTRAQAQPQSLTYPMTHGTPVLDPLFRRIFGSSFSAVSTPLIARAGASFCIRHNFAPLQSLLFTNLQPAMLAKNRRAPLISNLPICRQTLY